jgi:hypothetical protein
MVIHSTLEQIHRIIEAIEQAIEEKIYIQQYFWMCLRPSTGSGIKD